MTTEDMTKKLDLIAKVRCFIYISKRASFGLTTEVSL